jgi:hypothetical protein
VRSPSFCHACSNLCTSKGEQVTRVSGPRSTPHPPRLLGQNRTPPPPGAHRHPPSPPTHHSLPLLRLQVRLIQFARDSSYQQLDLSNNMAAAASPSKKSPSKSSPAKLMKTSTMKRDAGEPTSLAPCHRHCVAIPSVALPVSILCRAISDLGEPCPCAIVHSFTPLASSVTPVSRCCLAEVRVSQATSLAFPLPRCSLGSTARITPVVAQRE